MKSTSAKPIVMPKIAIVVHIHYVSTVSVIARAINSSVLAKSDLYVSVTPAAAVDIDKIKTSFPKAIIEVCENRGRDIRPFLQVVKNNKITEKYDLVLKIHGKRTEALPGYGAFWLVDSLNKLLPTTTQQVINLSENIGSFGIAGPSKQLFKYDEKTDKNDKNVKKTLEIMKIKWKSKKELYFFGGSMLWFDATSLKEMYSEVIQTDLFPEEKGQYDGTYAHAIERTFTLAPIIKQNSPVLVVDFQNDSVRPMIEFDVSIDGLIREYEEFSGKAVLVSMGGREYVLDYVDLKDLQARRHEDKINSENAIRTVEQPDNVHTLLIKTQEELNRIKSSKKYRLLEKVSRARQALKPKITRKR